MPVEILPHLFLGDANDAMNVSTDVTLVINCTKNIEFYQNKEIENEEHKTRFNIRIPVDDDGNETQEIYKYWTQELFDKIVEHISIGNNVLIHCQMGRQRSAATVAAYIMKAINWPLKKTIEYVKNKKRDAFFPEINFIKALEEFAVACSV